MGLIVSASTGPSKAEDWIPADGLDLDPDLRTLAAGKSGDAVMQQEEYKRRYAEWVEASTKAKADNQPAPPEPAAPGDDAKAPSYSTLFNGMISPILPCSIRGVAWYQGEANTGNPQLYRKLFPVLIRSWRQTWGQGDFPFLFVQLPGFRLKQTLPGNSEWAELREAQATALKLPKTGMAVTIDIGEDNIHPAVQPPDPASATSTPDDCARRGLHPFATWREVARRLRATWNTTGRPLGAGGRSTRRRAAANSSASFSPSARSSSRTKPARRQVKAEWALRRDDADAGADGRGPRSGTYKKPLKWFCTAQFFRSRTESADGPAARVLPAQLRHHWRSLRCRRRRNS